MNTAAQVHSQGQSRYIYVYSCTASQLHSQGWSRYIYVQLHRFNVSIVQVYLCTAAQLHSQRQSMYIYVQLHRFTVRDSLCIFMYSCTGSQSEIVKLLQLQELFFSYSEPIPGTLYEFETGLLEGGRRKKHLVRYLTSIPPCKLTHT